MDNKEYSTEVQEIIKYSKEEAMRLGNDYVGPEHLMLAIIRFGSKTPAYKLLSENLHIDMSGLKKKIEQRIGKKLDEDEWKTMHGAHILIDNDGDIIAGGPESMRKKKSKKEVIHRFIQLRINTQFK